MAKLHQILSVEGDIRSQSQKDLTAAHHGLQKTEMLSGLQKTYEPLKEDGDRLGAEGNLLQTRVPDVIARTAVILTRLFDVVATKDFGNMGAKADLVVNGTVLVKDAPAIWLLWLEKQLADIHTFIVKLPTTPADTKWKWDAQQICYVNETEIRTHRTSKEQTHQVVVQATDKFPAQVVQLTKDVIVGNWTTIKYSGAIDMKQVQQMKDRVELLMKEVKYAREKANQVEVVDQTFGAGILKYIFGEFAK